jgi:UDP-glucose 4-epimerase
MKKVLVTGGGGYIGSHMVNLLLLQNYEVEIIDNFSTGIRNRIPLQAKVYDRSIEDSKFLAELLSTGNFDAVIHFAGLKSVEESFRQENEYLKINFSATARLVDLITKYRVPRMIFSSSAAVYGSTIAFSKFCETDLCLPVNPYGESKYLSEKYIHEHSKNSDTEFFILRYFNVVGALKIELADFSGMNLFPLIIKSIKRNEQFTIHGDDYPTKDGSAVRDYIHVQDLVEAHLLALETSLVPEKDYPVTLNLGSGSGFSVIEIANSFEETAGKRLARVTGPRRIGDPALVIADTTLAKNLLGWEPKFNISAMVKSSWMYSI